MKIPRVPVIILKKDRAVRETAMVIPEVPFDVRLNNRHVATIVCRPDNPEEPSVGFLVNHGVFASAEDIKAIRVHPSQHTVSIQAQIDDEALKHLIRTVARSVSAPFPSLPPSRRPQTSGRKGKAPVRNEADLFRSLPALTARFQETVEVKGIFGAYHVAALASKKNLLLCEAGDVDMSVTVDRVFGKAFLSGIDCSLLTLLLSGRLRADTVGKAARHGVGCVVTTSVVTGIALDAALEAGVDIVGIKEGGILTVYSRNSPKDLGKLNRLMAGKGAFYQKAEKP